MPFFSHMLISTFHLLPEIHLKRKHLVKCINLLIIFLNTPGLWIHTFNLANFQSVCWIFLSDIADTYFRKIRNTNREKKHQRSCSFLPLVLFICCCLCWKTFSASPSATSRHLINSPVIAVFHWPGRSPTVCFCGTMFLPMVVLSSVIILHLLGDCLINTFPHGIINSMGQGVYLFLLTIKFSALPCGRLTIHIS